MFVRNPIDLPLDKANIVVRSSLSGRDYILRLDYHERQDRWFIHIFDQDGILLASGAKLITNWELFSTRRWDPRMPTGYLIPMTLGGYKEPRPDPPGFYDLGRRVFLYYCEVIP